MTPKSYMSPRATPTPNTFTRRHTPSVASKPQKKVFFPSASKTPRRNPTCQPQCARDLDPENLKPHPSKGATIARIELSSLASIFVITVLLIFCAFSQRDLVSTKAEFKSLMSDFQATLDLLSNAHLEIEKTEIELHRIDKIMSQRTLAQSGNFTYKKSTSLPSRGEIASNIIDTHDEQNNMIQTIQKAIQQQQYTSLLQRFGPGPYFVEFCIVVDGRRKYFMVETASSEEMPHSIYYFLDKVDNRLWDNKIFFHHWDHVVQAGMFSPEGEDMSSQFESPLAFPEYSSSFPHVAYTLGFPGRPGGPEFYINFDDNSDIHGPGQQDESEIFNDADPCFAKVIHGEAVIDLLEKFSHGVENAGDDEVMFSVIETARLMKKEGDKFYSHHGVPTPFN